MIIFIDDSNPIVLPEAKMFGLVGQSNARGFGHTSGFPPSNLTGPMTDCFIWNTHTNAWEEYEATVNSDTVTSGATTPQAWGAEAEFFRQYRLVNPTGEVYLVKMGVDSSPLSPAGGEDCWLPSEGELFTDFKNHLDAAKASLVGTGRTPKLYCVFNMQGEEDAEESSESDDYEDNLVEFISAVRSQWGYAGTKIVLGRILDRRTYSSVVRTAQANVAADDPLVEIIDTDIYPQTSDTRHYTAPGLVALGYDFFHSFNGTYPANELPDPDWNNVSIMAGFNGPDAATSYTEESNNALVATFTGTAQLSTADAITGSAAAKFTSAGGAITFPDSAGIHLSNLPFVIQFSLKFNSFPSATLAFMNQWNSGANQRSFAIDRTGSTNIQFAYSTAGTSTVSAFTPEFNPVIGETYKFTLERDSSNDLRLFQNGIMIAKTNMGSIALFDSSEALRFGSLNGFAGYNFDGIIDEVRIVKNEFLHGSDERFTVSASEFPRS